MPIKRKTQHKAKSKRYRKPPVHDAKCPFYTRGKTLDELDRIAVLCGVSRNYLINQGAMMVIAKYKKSKETP